MSAFRSLHVYRDGEARSAAMNMAVDEALLDQAEAPSLRFYSWQKPSLSFGYFGRYGDIAPHAAEREVVRRWTGGGIVLHGMDLTYSVVIPAKSVERIASSRFIYKQIHDAIRRALSAHTAVALATEDAPRVSEVCFANPVAADVLVGGRKIAGAAQRRTRAGLLHQGSIQYESLSAGFGETFACALCSEWRAMLFKCELFERAQRLADAKYGTTDWLRQR